MMHAERVRDRPHGFWREVPNSGPKDMTVCIAATSEEGAGSPTIVLCTDTKVSSALGSSESMLKLRSISAFRDKPNWKCLVSGTDHEIVAMLRLVQDQMYTFRSGGRVSEDTVLPAIKAAVTQRKLDKSNDLIRGKYGISYPEFLEHGKNRFPETTFRVALAEIESIGLEAELIIAGFNDIKLPVIIKVEHSGRTTIREGFAVVGEGSYLAQATLMNRAQSPMLDLPTTIYNTYEAKRYAEGAPSVGKLTYMSVLHSDGRQSDIGPIGLEFLDEKFAELGPKPIGAITFPDGTFR